MIHLSRRLLCTLFLADTPVLSAAERWRATMGAFLCVAVGGWLLHAMPLHTHWLLASVGASAVILFAMPHAPLAQPWPVVGSYLVATLVGALCAHAIGIPELAAAVAVAGSIWLMARLHCLHPPGGALALFMVLAGPLSPLQMQDLLLAVGLNLLVLLLGAALIHRGLFRRAYPSRSSPMAHAMPAVPAAMVTQTPDLAHEDLESAVRALDTFVDVQESELIDIYHLAVQHALERHQGQSVAAASAEALLMNARTDAQVQALVQQLAERQLQAIPVVNLQGQVVGMVTPADMRTALAGTAAARSTLPS